MGFNKRYVDIESLKCAAKRGLEYLISYVRKPDGLIIRDSVAKKVCVILKSDLSEIEMKDKLKDAGFIF